MQTFVSVSYLFSKCFRLFNHPFSYSYQFCIWYLLYNGFSYVTNGVHCGMAQATQTWKTSCLRCESEINNKLIVSSSLLYKFVDSRLKWVGHVETMNGDHLSRIAYVHIEEGEVRPRLR